MLKTIQVEVSLTGKETAEAFWHLDNDEQAKFFNYLGSISQVKLPFQMQFISDSKELNEFGRAAMEIIGNYAYDRSPTVLEKP